MRLGGGGCGVLLLLDLELLLDVVLFVAVDGSAAAVGGLGWVCLGVTSGAGFGLSGLFQAFGVLTDEEGAGGGCMEDL